MDDEKKYLNKCRKPYKMEPPPAIIDQKIYLPIMWKLQTTQISEEIYYSSICCRLFPKEQKGCRERTREMPDLLYIDKKIL